MAQDVHSMHRTQYKSSALCVWRRNSNGRGIQLMMGIDAQSSCLSFIETSRLESDHDLVKNFAKHRDWQSDFASLHWIPFDALFRSVFIDGTPALTLKDNSPARLKPYVLGALLHSQNKDLLINLHSKHAGDAKVLSPKKGGALRNTLRAFNTV